MNCMDIDNCSYFSDDHPREHSCHAPQLPRHPDGILQDDRQRQSKFLQPLHLLHLSPTQQQQQPPAPERHNWRFWPATRTTVGAKRHLRSFLQNQSVTHPMDSFLEEQYSPLPVLVKLLALCGQKGTLVWLDGKQWSGSITWPSSVLHCKGQRGWISGVRLFGLVYMV